ncbi:hypothetical protein ACHAXS_003959 [Conticribra weissflogii]
MIDLRIGLHSPLEGMQQILYFPFHVPAFESLVNNFQCRGSMHLFHCPVRLVTGNANRMYPKWPAQSANFNLQVEHVDTLSLTPNLGSNTPLMAGDRCGMVNKSREVT